MRATILFSCFAVVALGQTPDTFIRLRDAPRSYAGQKYKGIRVNAAENGLEFYTTGDPSPTPSPTATATSTPTATPTP